MQHLRKKEIYGTATSMKKKFGKQLVVRDGPYCAACKKFLPLTSNNFSVDHIVPASKGGATVLANLQIMHKKCNVEKADIDPTRGSETSSSGYKAFEQAFEKAGITPASTFSRPVSPSPLSKTFGRK